MQDSLGSAVDPLRTYLLDEFAVRKGQNGAYSLRAFARDLRISPATLSQVLNGKRKLSPRNLRHVSAQLEIDSGALAISSLLASKLTNEAYRQLSIDEFHLISDWYCLAILNLAKLKKHRAQPEWIAERLAISPIEAKSGLERLLRLGLIEVRNGKIIRLAKPMTIAQSVPTEAIRKYHRANLKNAERAMDELPVDRREVTATTFAMRSADIKRAKDAINRFKREFSKTFESSNPTDIVTLSIQLFPVTREAQ